MSDLIDHARAALTEIREANLEKIERPIDGPQGAEIRLQGALSPVINLCANNYLGLADDARLAAAAKEALDQYGYGMASVRFICGTQTTHRTLEKALARFLGKDDAILFAACFDANGGLFEPLLGPDDAIVSDSLNHASIIDGVRLCKARRYRYGNGDMDGLEQQLKQARTDGAKLIMIATDGVFSMDGHIADLPAITGLAERYGAAVVVDDCHATGIMGVQGAGTPSHHGVADKVDLLTGTLGKALGGAIGGYIAGPAAVIDLLRQRSRPYLFSNALPPSVTAASIEAIGIIEKSDDLRRRLFEHAGHWRSGLDALGFELVPGQHPIIPVLLGDAGLAHRMADRLLDHGVFVTAFSYPVVPKGQARIRTQMNAAMTTAQLDRALEAFGTVGRELGII